MTLLPRRLAALPILCALGCGSSSPTSSTSPASAASSCSVTGQNTYVRDTMQNIYFWYKEIPNLDPAAYSSPEAYLEAIRYRPRDTTFSYIENKAAFDAFYSESQFIGLGVSYTRTSETELRVLQTYPGSPAAEAGIERGDYLTAINGKPVADLLRTGEINTIFGASEAGVAVDIQWRKPSGESSQARLVKRAVTIPTVSATATYESGGRTIGYVFLRNFVNPSVAALNAAFSQLQSEGANDLVLDLRYNGGGLVSVAQHLGGLIGGAPTNGKVFAEFFHNDKNASRNTVFRLEDPPQSLDVPRLVVIATRSSASASEAMINGLRPFMPVTVVGNTTYGKPVGQYSFDFCDKVLIPVAFTVRNARGEGDFFDGIPADCAAPDDLDNQIGSASEASLAEAIHVLTRGSCSGRAAGVARAQASFRARVPELRPANGWRQLIGAD